MPRLILNLGGIIVELCVPFEVVDVKYFKGPVWLDKHINVEIDVTQYFAVEFRRHIDIAVEFFELAIALSKSKNVIPAIEPVVFSTNRSNWYCSKQLVFDVFLKLGIQDEQ